MQQSSLSLFYPILSDEVDQGQTISLLQAEQLFDYFKNNPLFKWHDVRNNCEGRANSVCILLDQWGVPNYKGWVFCGMLLKKGIGSLKNTWRYHVAALLPVNENGQITNYILDPATSDKLISLKEWAEMVTDYPPSYYLIKKGDYYIYHHKRIQKSNWYTRNKRNFNYTIQGLSGINGLSSTGKAFLAFNKKRIRKTEAVFKNLYKRRPSFL